MEPDILLSKMAMPWNTYFLGAGASAGLAPLAGEIPKVMLTYVDELGGIPCGMGEPCSLRTELSLTKQSLLEQGLVSTNPLSSSKSIFLTNSHEAVLANFYDRMFLSPCVVDTCWQYRIFQLLSGKDTAIVTLNHDGLVREHASHIPCVELHGSPNVFEVGNRIVKISKMQRQLHLKEDLVAADEFGIYREPKPRIVRIGDNEDGYLWQSAAPLISSANKLLFVGYSFPSYDSQVRESLKRLLRHHTPEIHVIDHNAVHISDEMADYLETHVTPWTLDWACFSRAVVETSERWQLQSMNQLPYHWKEIFRMYDHLLGF